MGKGEKSGPAMRTFRLLHHQILIFRPQGKRGFHFLFALAAPPILLIKPITKHQTWNQTLPVQQCNLTLLKNLLHQHHLVAGEKHGTFLHFLFPKSARSVLSEVRVQSDACRARPNLLSLSC